MEHSVMYGLCILAIIILFSAEGDQTNKLNFIEKHYNVKVVEVITDGVKSYEIKEVK